MRDFWVSILPGIEFMAWTAKNALVIYVTLSMWETVKKMRRK